MFALFNMRAWTEWLLSDVGRPKPCFTQSLPRPLFKNEKRAFCAQIKNMVKKTYTFIALFAGLGSLSERFVRVGFLPIAHIGIAIMLATLLKTMAAFNFETMKSLSC